MTETWQSEQFRRPWIVGSIAGVLSSSIKVKWMVGCLQDLASAVEESLGKRSSGLRQGLPRLSFGSCSAGLHASLQAGLRY